MAHLGYAPVSNLSLHRRSLERILYVRAIRNPATSYVQGMNDLVTPFFTGRSPNGVRDVLFGSF